MMADYVEDFIAWPVMIQMAACLESTVLERGLPALCRSNPVPGPLAVIEACSCSDNCKGMGWVRLVEEYPSSQFPSADQDGGKCGSPMAFTLEVGIARCLHTGSVNKVTGNFTPPSVENLMDDVRLQMADKAAMLRAIQCCLTQDGNDNSYSLGAYGPMQATGDCAGGYWTVTIWSM